MSNHEDTLPLGTYYNQEYVAKLALKVLRRDGLLAYHNGETPIVAPKGQIEENPANE